MNQLLTPESTVARSIPIFYFGPNDRVTIDGKHLTVVNQTTEGSVLKNADDIHEPFTHEQIYMMTTERRIKVDRDYHTEGSSLLALKYGNFKISDFADYKVQKALWLEEVIKEYIRFEAIGKKHPVLKAEGFRQRKVSLGVDCLKFLLPILKRIVSERWSMANGGAEISYKLPSPRHFRRLHDLYIDSNFDALALVSLKTGPKSRTVHRQKDLELWLKYVDKYADKDRPSMRSCYLELVAAVDELNDAASDDGYHYCIPSRKAFENLIKSFGVYHLMAKRHGEEYARKKFQIAHGGLEIERPGQIVEMDEWKVNLVLLLTHLRIWNMLSKEEQKAVERARVWVTVAIDRATKCILAMHFSRRAPSSRSSLAALEMVVSDKTLISSVVGAGTPWEYGLKPETLLTDAGPAFVHNSFRAAVAALRCVHAFPPTGKPAARGTIESFFHTCELRFMHYFSGRTFSNILEKGKRNPKEEASLNLDEFNSIFVRAILDIYHNTPHWGLGHETPANAWRRLSRKCAIMQPIGAEDRRTIFGTELVRTITDKGVASTGIHYDHTDLQRMRFEQQSIPHADTPTVTIRVSRLDLSAISFRNANGEWIEAKASIGIPHDTTIFEWVAARREWLMIHGENAKANLSAMLKSVREIRATGTSAAMRAGLGVDRLIAENYEHIEREYFKEAIIDDLLARAPELAPLTIPHNPLEVGLEVFDSIMASEPMENQKVKEAEILTQQESAFSGTVYSDDDDGDDGLFFDGEL
ncbi:transposase [Rhizobium ruizarguesonis]|uniref:DDE-type integrase/transposase/recombinase n=1 Tax=Rhizobium ruizarguesonis TaxID=2081791 RepID=UPI0010309ADA|nr:DDE-type integrase/transposase/recombinase [Rhizobium ruizarguesonis]TBA20960.1 transposase [Rhizobium ruizarguesonis]